MPGFFQPRTDLGSRPGGLTVLGQRMTETYGTARPVHQGTQGDQPLASGGFSQSRRLSDGFTRIFHPAPRSADPRYAGTGGDQPPAASIGGGDSPYSGGGSGSADAASSETAGSPFAEVIATWSKGWRAIAVLLVVALIVLYFLRK